MYRITAVVNLLNKFMRSWEKIKILLFWGKTGRFQEENIFYDGLWCSGKRKSDTILIYDLKIWRRHNLKSVDKNYKKNPVETHKKGCHAKYNQQIKSSQWTIIVKYLKFFPRHQFNGKMQQPFGKSFLETWRLLSFFNLIRLALNVAAKILINGALTFALLCQKVWSSLKWIANELTNFADFVGLERGLTRH